jgi:nucleotide-binding universal stress UspA family protein
MQTSLRAVQTAAQAMDDLRDNLIILSLGRQGNPKDKEMFDRCSGKARDIAMKNHIPVFRIYTEFFEVKDEPVDKTLCSIANVHANGSSILVLGAAGKGDEEKGGRRPDGQPPMGTIAKSVLERCKVPVLLVKSGAKMDLDVPRVKRQGRDSTPGLNIMVSMDTSIVSERAFDLACKIGTRLDSLFVYHVQMDESSDHLVSELTVQCDKLVDSKNVKEAMVITELRSGKGIREQIDDFVDAKAIDVLFMGSSMLPGQLHPCCNIHSRGRSPQHFLVPHCLTAATPAPCFLGR